MIKIALLGLMASMVAIQFKPKRPEYAMYIGICACILIFAWGITKLSGILSVLDKLTNYISISPTYLSILLKMIGITYVAEFSANLCKDAGQGAVANQIELVGKLAILSLSMPVVVSLLDTIKEFLA